MAEMIPVDSSDLDYDDINFEPQEESEGGIFDLLSQQKESVGAVRHNASQLSKIRSVNNKSNMWDEYNQAELEIKSGVDPEDAMREETTRYVSAIDAQVNEQIGALASSGDQASQDLVVELMLGKSDFSAGMLEQLMEADGPEQLISQAFANESTPDFIRRREAAASYAMRETEQFYEDRGWGEGFVDTMVEAFSVDYLWDMADFVGKNEFLSFENGADFMLNWQSLDPDVQTEIFPEILPEIVEHFDDNSAAVKAFVSTMFSPSFRQEMANTTAFEVLNLETFSSVAKMVIKPVVGAVKGGIAARKAAKSLEDVPVGADGTVAITRKLSETEQDFLATALSDSKIVSFPALTASKALLSLRSTPKQMQSLGNDVAAAESVLLAGLQPGAGTVLGISKLDAASTISPFRTDNQLVVNGALDNLSDITAILHRSTAIPEASLGARLREASIIRSGITPAVKRQADIALTELPSKITALSKQITLLDKALVKLKKAKKSDKKAQGQKRILEGELRTGVATLKVMSSELSGAREVAKRVGRATRIDTEAASLRAGVVPDTLKESVKQATAGAEKILMDARIAAPKLAESRKAIIKQIAARTSDDVAKIVVNNNLMKVGAKLTDDPMRWGVNPALARGIQEMMRSSIDDTVAEIERLTPDAIRAIDKAAVKREVQERIVKEAEDSGSEVRVADIKEMDDAGGFTVTYHRDGSKGTLEYRYTFTDAGVFEGVADMAANGSAKALSTALSPDLIYRQLDSALVNDLTFAEGQAAKFGNTLKKLYVETRKGLTSRENFELDALLKAGDEQGVIFSMDDLAMGSIQTIAKDGPYSDAVIRSYYKSRIFYDELHTLNNHITRRKLEFIGYKNFDYAGADGVVEKFMGLPRKRIKADDLPERTGVWMPGSASGGGVRYSNLAAARQMVKSKGDDSFEIVELFQPHRLKSGEEVKYALVSDNLGVKRTNPPAQVLNYQPGYIPRIYRSGYHFVKDTTDPGKTVTLFAAETKDIANKLAANVRNTDSKRNIVVKGDREVTPAEQMVNDANTHGGLYTGSRKQAQLVVKGLDGSEDKLVRASVGDSTERYLQNIASVMPMAEYRTATMQRFVNSVNMIAKAEGRQGMAGGSFGDNINLSAEPKALMENAKDYLSAQMRIPTIEEKAYTRRLQNLADSLYEGIPYVPKSVSDSVRKATLHMLDKDPVQSLKGFTFNAHMGWFNVRQLLVQVQNAGNAIAISPKHAPGAIADALQMRMAVLSDDPRVWKAAAKYATQGEDEFVASIKQFKESGLMDSIKRQGDYDASNIALGGRTMAAARKAAELGRIPFTEGELWARMLSFSIAKRSLGKGATTRQIFDEHLRMSTNMQAANQASWQKGVLGIPTQYMQVFTKFYERVLPSLMFGKEKGVWSRAEAWRVMGFQLAAYGTVGVPFAEDVYGYLADLNGKTPADMEAEMPFLREAVEEGMTGVISSAFGFENNFSKDMSLLAGSGEKLKGVAEVLMGAVNEGQADMDAAKLLMGPSLSAVTRTADVFTAMATAAQAIVQRPTLEQLGAQAINVTDSVLSITSTWSNAEKAIFLHDVGVVSKRGAALVGAEVFDEMNIQTILGRGMGFPTDIEVNYWKVKDINMTRRGLDSKRLAALRNAYNQSLQQGNLESYNGQFAVLTSGLSDPEARELNEKIIRGLTGTSDVDKQNEQWTKDFINSGGKYPISPFVGQ